MVQRSLACSPAQAAVTGLHGFWRDDAGRTVQFLEPGKTARPIPFKPGTSWAVELERSRPVYIDVRPAARACEFDALRPPPDAPIRTAEVGAVPVQLRLEPGTGVLTEVGGGGRLTRKPPARTPPAPG